MQTDLFATPPAPVCREVDPASRLALRINYELNCLIDHIARSQEHHPQAYGAALLVWNEDTGRSLFAASADADAASVLEWLRRADVVRCALPEAA